MASEPDRLCKDCWWAEQPRWWWSTRCRHPKAKAHGSSSFFLSGDPYFLPKCENVRDPSSACGHEGKLWMSKTNGERET